MGVTEICDIAIIVGMSFVFLRLMMKTEAMKMILGIAMIYIISLASAASGLANTAAILERATNTLIIGMVVIFHPELRMALKKIGSRITNLKTEQQQIVFSIEDAVFSMAEKKIGALIILDPNQRLLLHTENATPIGGDCTRALLETIFFPNTPLHDGAVVIQNEKIAFAGCKFPITGKKRVGLEHLGTRHIAAIETAERHEVIAIIVSEETGNVSIATSNGLYRVKSRNMFEKFFKEEKQKKTWFENIIKKNKN